MPSPKRRPKVYIPGQEVPDWKREEWARAHLDLRARMVRAGIDVTLCQPGCAHTRRFTRA